MAMFDWIPYLQGKYLSYYQWFAFIGSFACLVFAFINLLIYLVFSKFQIHRKNYAILSWVNNNTSFAEKVKSFTFKAAFIWLSLIPLICQALDVIFLITGILGQLSILVIGIYLDNGRKLWKQDHELISNNQNSKIGSCSMIKQYISLCLRLTKLSKKTIIICAIVATLANLFMYKTCLCFYNSEIGYYNSLLGFGLNTCFVRMLELKDSCPPGAPCQMYTTIPQNPSTAIFLNLHTHVDVKTVDVYYQQLLTDNITQFNKVTAQLFQYEGLERKARRNVHSALIMGLKPNTKYLTKVFYSNTFWTNAIFKTLPAPGDKKTPIRMINAGDSGYNEAAVNLSKIVSTMKPDIFFMGGDIAYDDNMPACAYTWDYFLGMYGRITATLGYLMPIVATVGNHDVGLNQLPGVNITVSNSGPAFHIYFPQHYDQNLDGHIIQKVPPLNKRRTVFNFTFGNVHYLALDSGYMHGFDGFQKKFMIDSFQANKDKIKFVNYHVPIYSVCQSFDSDPTRFLYALFHWVPNFDKYHVMAAFENHVHSFKRTKPLVGSSPTQFGTVYMGDGAYGAIISQMCKPDATIDIFDAFAKKNNFWLSQITQNKVQHWAYDSHGTLIDHFIQYPQNYTVGTARGDYTQKQINYQITIEQAKKIVQNYYTQEQLQIEEKLPLKDKIIQQSMNKAEIIEQNNNQKPLNEDISIVKISQQQIETSQSIKKEKTLENQQSIAQQPSNDKTSQAVIGQSDVDEQTVQIIDIKQQKNSVDIENNEEQVDMRHQSEQKIIVVPQPEIPQQIKAQEQIKTNEQEQFNFIAADK